MNKGAILGLFAVLLLGILLSTVSAADSYTNYWNSNSYTGSAVGIVYPSYTYAPTVSQQIASMAQSSNFYNSNTQGAVMQRTITYNQDLNVKSATKFTQSINARVDEFYFGGSQLVNSGNQQSQHATNNYNLNSPNPTSYNGGSYWRSAPQYDSTNYGSNSYTSPYYYAPRYDQQQGYYNWGY